MASYLVARGMPWEAQRYMASWTQFDNLVISAGETIVGVLRLLEIPEALEIRDLQVLPSRTGQGIGTWAI